MSKLKKLLVEDWVVTFLAIPLLVIAGLAGEFPAIKRDISIPSTLITADAPADAVGTVKVMFPMYGTFAIDDLMIKSGK